MAIKIFLVMFYLFITYNSYKAMKQLMSTAQTLPDIIQVGTLCTMWMVLITIGGAFIYSIITKKK